MPTIQRTLPGTITFPSQPPQYPSGTAAATIAGFKAAILTLKNVVMAGHVIEASHFRILAGIYNAYRLHTHAYPDLRGVWTFGDGHNGPPGQNNPVPYSSSGTYASPNPKSTSAVTSAPGPLSVVTPASGGALPIQPPGDSPAHADFNTINTGINFMRTHSHTISDQTS